MKLFMCDYANFFYSTRVQCNIGIVSASKFIIYTSFLEDLKVLFCHQLLFERFLSGPVIAGHCFLLTAINFTHD